MELSKLDPERSAPDFANALQQLLPPGEYWTTESKELNKVLLGLGTELKTTHDETKLTFLFEIDNNQLGWKISDYQALLNDKTEQLLQLQISSAITFDDQGIYKGSNQVIATAYDDPNYPNIIFIAIHNTKGFLEAMQTLEKHRLPHTNINFNLNYQLGIHVNARPVIYTRLELEEA